jgi:hypothetical protein
VRVVVAPPRRQADQFQQLAHLAPRPVAHGVQGDRLLDLAPDPLHRVERVQRPLEHDRQARPADGPQPAGLHGEDVLAVEQHLPAHRGAAREQPQQRTRQRRLAAARLAREPDGLARRDVEVDAADRLQRRAARVVGDVQVADREQRRRLLDLGRGAHQRSSRRRGSRISSSAWPTSVNASTTSTIPIPGGR